jgi:hypothetical protein
MVLQPYQRRIRVRRLLLAVGACGALAGLGILAVYPPTDASSFYPGCIFHQCTGLHCPGCGLTRALHSLLNGRIQQAVAYNGVGLVLFAIVAVSLVRSLWSWASDERVGERDRTSWRWPWWAKYAIGTFMILYGIARNLPIEPFTALAPHELKPPPSEKKVAAEDGPS